MLAPDTIEVVFKVGLKSQVMMKLSIILKTPFSSYMHAHIWINNMLACNELMELCSLTGHFAIFLSLTTCFNFGPFSLVFQPTLGFRKGGQNPKKCFETQ